METKRIVILGVFVIFFAAGFLFYFFIYKNGSINANAISNVNVTDSHECLFHQGYTWNETEQACVREWIPGPSRYQNNTPLVPESNSTLLNWTTSVNITGNNLTSKNESNQSVFNVSGLNKT